MASSTPNVLIVDSDARQTELVTELVNEVVRAKVDSTNSGERAIELVSRMPYQLVIADCGIGDMDGVAVLERVKHVSPTTGVILTSAFTTVEEAVKAMRFGAEEYLKKPFNPENFKLAVRRCLDRRALYAGDQAVTGLMLLLNACQLVSGCLEEEKIFETVTGYLKRETSSKGVALFRMVNDEKERVPVVSDEDAEIVEVIVEGHGFLKVARDEKVSMKIIPKSNTTPEVAVFRFRCVGNVEYFVVCLAPMWKIPPEELDSRFRLLQAQIQMTGRNIENYRGVRHLLYLDEPTGLYNTRYLHVCLEQWFQKWGREKGKGFSVLFLDVDKFKGINDQYGHLVGTKLLFEIGQIIKRNLRDSDVALRYGGDEFVMLVNESTIEEARVIAERIREEVESTKFLSREGLNVHLTVSIGIANCPEHATSKREIIDAADSAMYAVKRSSRNSVYVAERKAA